MYRLNALFTKYSKSVPLVASIPAIIAGNDWYEYIRHNNTTKSHTNSSFKPSLTLRSVRLFDTSIVDDMNRVFENVLPSVVQIMVDSRRGTGFVVHKSGLIVTNCHVVRDSEYVSIKLSAQRNISELKEVYALLANSQLADTLSGHVIFCATDYDLAVIRVYVISDAIPALPLASYGVSAGEPLLAIGSPGLSSFACSLGFALGPDQLDHLLVRHVLTHYAHTKQGMSGGPIVNRKGTVMGVCFWGNRECSMAELAINASSKSFMCLYGCPKGSGRETLTKAMKFETKSMRQRYSMGDKRSLGVMLKHTKDGFVVTRLGIDAAEGLAENDVIVKINGKPLEAFRQLEKAMQSLPEGQPLELTVHREGADDPIRSVTPLSGLNHNCSRF